MSPNPWSAACINEARRMRALHDPMTRPHCKAFYLICSLDALQRERRDTAQCDQELRPDVTAIGKDLPEPRPTSDDGFESCCCTVGVLNLSTVTNQPHHGAKRIDNDSALAAFDLSANAVCGLTRIIARNPPHSVISTL